MGSDHAVRPLLSLRKWIDGKTAVRFAWGLQNKDPFPLHRPGNGKTGAAKLGIAITMHHCKANLPKSSGTKNRDTHLCPKAASVQYLRFRYHIHEG